MYKKFAFLLAPLFLIIFFLLPVQQTLAVTTTKTTTTTTTENKSSSTPAPSDNKQIEEIKTIIGKNTPSFISKPIIWLVNVLENFRKNYFNNVFIFYGLFFVALFMIVRSIWRFFF